MIEDGRHARPRPGTSGVASRKVHPSHQLLANFYMRRFVLGWKKLGLEHSLGTRIVNYADDLVILCRKSTADEALQRLREIMGRLKLTVNEEKTRLARCRKASSTSLGYTFGRMYSARTGKARLGQRPSKKSIRHMVEKVHVLTDRAGTWQETTELVDAVEPRATRMGQLTSALAAVNDSVSGDRQLRLLCGCAGGCASSTRSGDARAGPIHSRISTGTSGSYAYAGLGTTCRG